MKVFPTILKSTGPRAFQTCGRRLSGFYDPRDLTPGAVQKYDVRRPDGRFEEKYWSPLNTPILNQDGAVEWIVHRVEYVMDLVLYGTEKAERDAFAKEQQLKL